MGVSDVDIYPRACTHTCVYPCIHACMCVCVHVDVCACKQTHIHACNVWDMDSACACTCDVSIQVIFYYPAACYRSCMPFAAHVVHVRTLGCIAVHAQCPNKQPTLYQKTEATAGPPTTCTHLPCIIASHHHDSLPAQGPLYSQAVSP